MWAPCIWPGLMWSNVSPAGVQPRTNATATWWGGIGTSTPKPGCAKPSRWACRLPPTRRPTTPRDRPMHDDVTPPPDRLVVRLEPCHKGTTPTRGTVVSDASKAHGRGALLDRVV